MSCTHTSTTDIATRCFTSSVAWPHSDEDPAAHGGVCVEVECDACGARRRENRNGRHVELGPWGPTRSERRQAEVSA